MTEDDSRVVLYTRAGCHLCAAARAVVREACEKAGARWREVDIDTDAELVVRYGELVPVVTVDEVRQGFWTIDPVRLAGALAAGGSAAG